MESSTENEDTTVTVDEPIDDIEAKYRGIDRVIGEALVRFQEEQDRTPSCPTCTTAGCCYNRVDIFLFEALPIVRYLERAGRLTRRFRQRLEHQGRAMEGHGSDEWLDRSIGCVFLENNRCTIYDVRPIRCRDYYAFTPPEQCLPPSGKTVGTMDRSEIDTWTMDHAEAIHQALEIKYEPKLLLGALPRVLWIVARAWHAKDFAKAIESQIWPTIDKLPGWLDGRNPFRKGKR